MRVNLNLSLREIVIGHTIEAAVYAFWNDLPLLVNSRTDHLPCEYLEKNFDCKLFGIENKINLIKTETGKIEYNIQKEELRWNLFFYLGLAGKLPFSHSIQSISLEEDGVEVFLGQGDKAKIECEKINIFNIENVDGLGTPIKYIEKYQVLDWIETINSHRHDFDVLFRFNFPKEIWFFQSVKQSRQSTRDILAISLMSPEELYDSENSDTNIRLFIKNEIERIIPGPTKKKTIRLSPLEREVRFCPEFSFEDTKLIKFINFGLEDIISKQRIFSESSLLVWNTLTDE